MDDAETHLLTIVNGEFFGYRQENKHESDVASPARLNDVHSGGLVRLDNLLSFSHMVDGSGDCNKGC